MTYPTWAPPLLVAMHKHASVVDDEAASVATPSGVPPLFLDAKSRETLLRALVTDQRMADVWLSLAGWSDEFKARLPKPQADEIPDELLEMPDSGKLKLSLQTNQLMKRSQPGSLYRACEAALCSWERIPKWTRTEEREHYRNIAEHAENLASLLCDIRWCNSGSRMQSIVDFTDASHFEGLASAFDLDSDPDLARLGGAGDYVRFWVSDALPDLTELLLKMSAEARKREKDPRALGQPNSPRAKLRFFQEHVSAYFSGAYGRPLNKQVADVCSAVFGCDVTEENVRKLVRYRQRLIGSGA